MALARIPGLRTLGEEVDQVTIEVTVTGRRTAEVLRALDGVYEGKQTVPVSIGIPGLDKITGGVLTEANLIVHFPEDDDVTFTITATEEREDG